MSVETWWSVWRGLGRQRERGRRGRERVVCVCVCVFVVGMDVDSSLPSASTSSSTTSSVSSLPWVEKYRPESLDELVSHSDITETLRNFLNKKKLPHLLFYGPAGTGKTSTIKACAKQLYGSTMQNFVLEMNASYDTGIDVVREQIRNFSSTRMMFSSGFKLIILDEADMFSKDAQAALRRMMEKYTRNVRFCLVCNNVNKIIPAIQSRCMRFRFSPLSRSDMVGRLRQIADIEGVSVTEKALRALHRLSNGDMRKSLNVLQSVALSNIEKVDEEHIYSSTGNPTPGDILDIVQGLLNENIRTNVKKISDTQKHRGYSLVDIVRESYRFVLQVDDIPDDVLGFVLEHMADIEFRLASGCHESTQLPAFAGAFALAREAASNTESISKYDPKLLK